MKKLLFSTLAVMGLSTAFSQIMDSTVVVNDSLITKGVRTRGGLLVDENVLLKQDLRVKKDFFVGEQSNFVNKATFEGKVKMTGLDDVTNFETASFLFSKGNGLVEKALLFDVLGELYKVPCKTDLSGNILNPTWQNGTNKLFSPCPVNVGIGNSDPRVRLDVSGRAFVTHLAIGADPVNMVGRFHLRAADLGPNNASVLFLIENAQRQLVRIDNQGNLKVREAWVDLAAWPDYVFTPEYDLMPLTEVESFIKDNCHLPQVPSASTLEREGVNLGDMNKILMEKIEQLTLYAIDQEKRLIEQAARNEQQDAIIRQLQEELLKLK